MAYSVGDIYTCAQGFPVAGCWQAGGKVGVVIKEGKVFRQGSCWGHDQMLLSSDMLFSEGTALTMTYVEVLTLTRQVRGSVWCRGGCASGG